MAAPENKTQGTKMHWEQVYTTKQNNEVSWYEPLPQVSLEMLQAESPTPAECLSAECLSKDARILDVGGGSSRLAATLLDRGYTNITVLDITEAALDRARRDMGERADRVRWIAADITCWSPKEQYDVWHDRAVFHFLTQAQDRAAYLAALTTAIAPGGRVVLATFAFDGPERCSGLPIQRYTPPQLGQELGSAFELQQSRRVDHCTPAGIMQPFEYTYFCRR